MTDIFERLQYITSGEPEWRIPRLQRAVAYAMGVMWDFREHQEFIGSQLHSVADLKGELICTWDSPPPLQVTQAIELAWIGPCGDGIGNVMHDVL